MTITATGTDEAEALRVMFDRLALALRTATPGVVRGVSADGTTVDVQPAVSLRQRLEESEEIPLPVIRGVPLHVYGSTSLGLFVCAPISEGDDGLLVTCDRALDNWQHGAGVAAPPDAASPRHHDLTDVVFVPGLQRLAGAIPGFPTDALELRTRDGTTKVRVKDGEVSAQVGTASLSLTSAGFSVTVGGAVIAWTASGLTINGHPYLDHKHDKNGGGPGFTLGVTP